MTCIIHVFSCDFTLLIVLMANGQFTYFNDSITWLHWIVHCRHHTCIWDCWKQMWCSHDSHLNDHVTISFTWYVICHQKPLVQWSTNPSVLDHVTRQELASYNLWRYLNTINVWWHGSPNLVVVVDYMMKIQYGLMRVGVFQLEQNILNDITIAMK